MKEPSLIFYIKNKNINAVPLKRKKQSRQRQNQFKLNYLQKDSSVEGREIYPHSSQSPSIYECIFTNKYICAGLGNVCDVEIRGTKV